MATFKLLSLAFNGPSWFSLPAPSFHYCSQNAISQPVSPASMRRSAPLRHVLPLAMDVRAPSHGSAMHCGHQSR